MGALTRGIPLVLAFDFADADADGFLVVAVIVVARFTGVLIADVAVTVATVAAVVAAVLVVAFVAVVAVVFVARFTGVLTADVAVTVATVAAVVAAFLVVVFVAVVVVARFTGVLIADVAVTVATVVVTFVGRFACLGIVEGAKFTVDGATVDVLIVAVVFVARLIGTLTAYVCVFWLTSLMLAADFDIGFPSSSIPLADIAAARGPNCGKAADLMSSR